jgi:hypothetical protein
MREVTIQAISLDSAGRLRLQVSPSWPSGYKYIWRDATNVAWNEPCGELFARDALTHVEQFKRIVGAVAREYGDQLILLPSTAFVDVPEQLIAELRACAV